LQGYLVHDLWQVIRQTIRLRHADVQSGHVKIRIRLHHHSIHLLLHLDLILLLRYISLSARWTIPLFALDMQTVSVRNTREVKPPSFAVTLLCAFEHRTKSVWRTVAEADLWWQFLIGLT
jgi:hypothetical protein